MRIRGYFFLEAKTDPQTKNLRNTALEDDTVLQPLLTDVAEKSALLPCWQAYSVMHRQRADKNTERIY